MKIGFIGCGNMASAIIKGITAKGKVNGSDIVVYDIYAAAAENISKMCGAEIASSEEMVAKKADIVFLAVKPNVLSDVLKKISSAVAENKPLVVSIAAGKTIEFLSQPLDNDTRIIRVMPHINAKVGEAICAYCFNRNVTDAD